MNNNLPNPFLGINVNVNQPAQVSVKPKTPKGVKAGNNGTHIVVILDESGSMSVCHDTTIDGFNEYMNGQRVDAEKTKDEIDVSVVKFEGGNVIKLHKNVDIHQLPKLDRNTYYPRGGTNLLDAVGQSILETDKILKDSGKKKDRPAVLFVIFTDGQENMSREFDNETIKNMVKDREDRCDWGFTFFGANIDAFAAGSVFGMRQSNTVQYDTSKMTESFAVASASTTRYREAKKLGMTTADVYASGMYTDEERNQAKGE